MMARQLAHHLSAPPLAYAGEREQLRRELGELKATLRRNAPGSIYTPALQRRLTAVTARLLGLGGEPLPVPGSDRRDLQ